jgi:hypothetical protein
MTPLQFVCEECANHQPDGSCLGVMIEEDLSIRRGTPRPRCLVAEAKRCPYFEECVAPMADMASDPRRAAALQEAVAEYRQITNQKSPKARPCPDCGRPMQKGRQYCPRCAGTRRKDTHRRHNSGRAGKPVGITTEVQKSTPSFPGNKGPILAVPQNAMEDGGPPQNDQTSVVPEPTTRRAS